MTREDKKYWLELAERYFEATATEEEEAALRRFLATDEAADGAFDEARAVAGFAAAGKSSRRRRTAARRRFRMAVAAAAAVVLVTVLPGLLSGGGDTAEGEVCVAYVGGVEYTDEAVVLAQARSTMDGMGRAAEEMSPEAQMREMFRLIDE